MTAQSVTRTRATRFSNAVIPDRQATQALPKLGHDLTELEGVVDSGYACCLKPILQQRLCLRGGNTPVRVPVIPTYRLWDNQENEPHRLCEG